MSPSDHPSPKAADPPGSVDNIAKHFGDSSDSQAQVHSNTVLSRETDPSDNDQESSPAAQPRHHQKNAGDPDASRDLPLLFEEIRQLRLRLQDIEAEAVFQWDSGPKDLTLEHQPSNSGSAHGKLDAAHADGIQEASSDISRIKSIEREFQKTADERREYGQAPNKVPREELENYGAEAGGNAPTMYHVQKDGTMSKGHQRAAIFGTNGWYDQHRGGPYYIPGMWSEVVMRNSVKPYPDRGIRPPTNLRPFQHTESTAKSKVKVPKPAKSTTRLGPPTRWDTSDSEEWSSETSTRSQDFRYFRSRLRGDFEWELDRLNAQSMRFDKHKEKKMNRLAALQAKEEDDRIEKAYHEHGLQPPADRLKPDGNIRRAKLNPVDWETFKLARRAPKELSAVIDILTEEPKVRKDPWMKIFKSTQPSTTNQNKITVTTSEKTEANEDPLIESRQWNGQGVLPERIRINSKSIIEGLTKIHGSALCDNSDKSLIILRPFRILNAYEREIRELVSKLTADITRAKQQTQIEAAATQTAAQNNLPVTSSTSISQGVSDQEGKVSSAPAATQTSPVQENTVNIEELEIQKEHLACLQLFMDEYTVRKTEYLNSVNCNKIVFFDLWHLFQPGTLVISADGKQAYQVVNIRSKQHKVTDRWAMLDEFGIPGPAAKDSDSSSSKDEKQSRYDISIKCVYIHFDGHAIGPATKTFGINKWDGEKDTAFLEVYPLRVYILRRLKERPISTTTELTITEDDVGKEVKKLQHKLVERGKLFARVASVKQMYYSGLAVNTRDEIESQVMVDFEAALSDKRRQHWAPKIRRLIGTDWNADQGKDDEICNAECCRDESVHNDSYVETRNSQNFINTMMAKIEDTPHKLPSPIVFPRTMDVMKTSGSEFTEDELMIMSYSVFGFVLRDRTWAELDLDCLSDVAANGATAEHADDGLDESNRGAFGRLVLPKGHKEMVLSLISQHFRSKGSPETSEDQVDIVRGKGKGLIILLHGAPGVGKTTTAEGVAERFGKPLFQITCGDLGSSPKEVESALQTNFALANRWGCILLLDEADVFLAERRREDFNRNGMVAVFLRVLEYYAGILFLTTNRIGDFDEAFASRIHMSLYYPALDEKSTMQVFKLNLSMIKNRLKDRISIDEDDIIIAAMKHWREYEHARWNGRQIRNACQTALALAENEAQPEGQEYNIRAKSTNKVHLTLEHLKVVSDSYLKFTDYLKVIHGTDAERRAHESGIRALGTLVEALRSERGRNNEEDGRHFDKDQRRPGGDNSSHPLHDINLRSHTSGHPPSNTGLRTPEPAQPAPNPVWMAPQWSQDSPHLQTQRMEHTLHGSYPGYQPLSDTRTGPPTTQPSHLHTPQSYGTPAYFQHSSPQAQGTQPYGTAYPDVITPHAPVGPSSQGPIPGYYTSSDQGGQNQRPGTSPFAASDQL